MKRSERIASDVFSSLYGSLALSQLLDEPKIFRPIWNTFTKRRLESKQDFTVPPEEMTEIVEGMKSGMGKVPPPMHFDDEEEIEIVSIESEED